MPELTEIVSEDRALGIYNQFKDGLDGVGDEDADLMAGQLRGYLDSVPEGQPLWPQTQNRLQVETEQRYSKSFASLEAARQSLSPEAQRTVRELSSVSEDPDEYFAGMMNQAFAMDLLGVDSQQLADGWEYYAQQIDQQLLGEEGGLTETQRFAKIGQVMQRQAGRRTLFDQAIPQAGINAALGDLMDGKTQRTSWIESWAKFKEQALDGNDLIEPEDLSEMQRIFQSEYRAIHGNTREVVEKARTIFEAVNDENDSVTATAKVIADTPKEELEEALYFVSIMAQEQAGPEEPGIFAKMWEGLGRSTIRYVSKRGTATVIDRAEGVRSALESGAGFVRVPEDSSLSPGKYGLAVIGKGEKTTVKDAKDLTPKEKERIIAGLDDIQEKAEALDLAFDVVAGSRLPSRPRTLAEKMAVLPAEAAPIIGTSALTFAAFKGAGAPGVIATIGAGASVYDTIMGEEYTAIRRENPDMNRRDALAIAKTSATIQSGLEAVQGAVAIGKFGQLGKLFGGSANNVALRFSAQAAGAIVSENVLEGIQDLTTPAVQSVFSALNKDIPAVNWTEEFAQWEQSRGDVFFAVLPYALFGAGMSTYGKGQQIEFAKRFLTNPADLQIQGISSAAALDIVATQNLLSRAEKFAAAWEKRDTEAGRKYFEKTASELGKGLEGLESPVITRAGENWEVAFPDQTPPLQSPSFNDVQTAYSEWIAENRAQPVDREAGLQIPGETTASETRQQQAAENRQQAEEQGETIEPIVQDGKLGPGAANRAEFEKFKPSRFSERFINDPDIAPELKLQGEVNYVPITNRDTVRQVKAKMDEMGLIEFSKQITDQGNNLTFAQRVTGAELALKNINALTKKLQARQKAGEDVTEQIDDLHYWNDELVFSITNLGTQMGQGIQAFVLWNRLTPEGVIRAAAKAVKDSAPRKRGKTKKDIKKKTGKSVDQNVRETQEALDKADRDVEAEEKANPRTEEAQRVIDAFAKAFSDTPDFLKGKKRVTIFGLVRQYVKDQSFALESALAKLGVNPGQITTLKQLADEQVRRIEAIKTAKLEERRQKAIAKLIADLSPKPAKPEKTANENIAGQRFLRAIERARDLGALDNEAFLEAYEEAFGFQLTPEVRERLTTLAEEAMAAPEGFIKQDKARQIMAEIALLEEVTAMDIITAGWYASILSGMGTHAINIAGNAMNLAGRTMVTVATENPRDSYQFIKHLFTGMARGLVEGKGALRGREVYKGMNKFATPGTLELIRSKDPKGAAQRAKNAIALGRFLFRALQAEDVFFWRTATEARAALAASKMARMDTKGMGAKEYARAFNEVMHGMEADQEAAIEQAREDVKVLTNPTENDVMRRAYEILEERRGTDIIEASRKFGSRATFTNKPEGALGVLASASRMLVEKAAMRTPIGDIQVVRPILAFIDIVANVANTQVDYSPWGAARAKKGAHIFDIGAEPFEAGERKSRAAMAVMGSAVAVIAWAMDKKGEDEEDPFFAIYALGPKDSNKRSQMMSAGWKPYSIKFGDKYVAYNETPFGIMLAIMGGLRDAERYGGETLSRKSILERMSMAVGLSFNAFLEAGFLSGVKRFLGAVDGRGDVADTAINAAKGVVPASGLLRDVAKIMDPEIVDTRDGGYWAKFVSGIPAVQNIGTRPMLNQLGEPVERPAIGRTPGLSRFFSERTDDPVWLWLAQNDLWIPGTGTQSVSAPGLTRYQKRALESLKETRAEDLGRVFAENFTNEENYEFKRLSGQKLRVEIERIMAESEGMEKADIQKAINDAAREVRRDTKLEMLGL